MKRLFLFDLDGTLVSTGGAGLRALSRAFQQLYGVPDAMSRVNPSGKTDPAIFREMVRSFLDRDLEPGEGARLGNTYLEFLEEEVARPGAKGPLAGVTALVEHLARRSDAVLALGTGNLERGARIKLAPHGLNEFFPIGGFGSDAEARAEVLRVGHRRAESRAGVPIPPDAVYVIGDTPLDVRAAREAGFRALAVATGRSSVDVLRQSSPDWVLPDLTHGFSWLDSILKQSSAA
jgi:phosphoglycolate phosphatase-like HAD superfamily hydrolase